MKVYGVSLYSSDGLDVSYGMFSTEFNAGKYAKEKMTTIEKLSVSEGEVIDFSDYNIVITEYTVDEETERVVHSWIFRENGKFTPETEDDMIQCLEKMANEQGFTILDENGNPL